MQGLNYANNTGVEKRMNAQRFISLIITHYQLILSGFFLKQYLTALLFFLSGINVLYFNKYLIIDSYFQFLEKLSKSF